MVAAFVMSTIAFMQFSTPMVWGLLAERWNLGKLIMAKFLIQAVGILWALSDPGVLSLYAGFFLYGIGMGGTSILAEMIWANYFGRISLGTIRGMGSLLTSVFSAGGPPFFGILFDYTAKLLSLLQYLHRHALRLGFAKPLSPTAQKVTQPHKSQAPQLRWAARHNQSTSPDRNGREPYHPSLRVSVLRFRQPG